LIIGFGVVLLMILVIWLRFTEKIENPQSDNFEAQR